MATTINYNERSWGIELISEINLFLANKNISIKRASGELTVSTNSTRMFPDVVLYGNEGLLMGWELKMPDTEITNEEFISNARDKAEKLKLNSFLLWNAKTAVLYVKQNDIFSPTNTWDTSDNTIRNRLDVANNYQIWTKNLHTIICDLDNFVENNQIIEKPIIESFNDTQITDFILSKSSATAENIETACRNNSRIGASVNVWWRVAQAEYPNQNKFDVLAKNTIVSWINKIIFTHILIPFRNEAKEIYNLTADSSPREAIEIFNNISENCDFYNIFKENMCALNVSENTWLNLLELHFFLKNSNLLQINQDLLQNILQNTIYKTQRKIAGQYATPMFLARILASLTLLDKTQSVYDPCCGTGTIPKALYDIKKEAGINGIDALSKILASDKNSFALQMATIALSEPSNINEVIKIFQKDIFELNIADNITLINPNDGTELIMEFLPIQNIVCNMPFVRQENINDFNQNAISSISSFLNNITNGLSLSRKSDLSAYMPFKFWQLLSENGRCGVIMSNSWLATEWGNRFKKLLIKFYKIEYIVASNNSKWFNNADIITNVIILQKRNHLTDSIDTEEQTNFISLSYNFEQNGNNQLVEECIDNILSNTKDDFIKIQSYNTHILYESTLGWNAYFSNLAWLDEINGSLIDARNICSINRGMRRGWNDMFYPNSNSNVDSRFIKPALRSSRNIKRLIAIPDKIAFVCDKSTSYLEYNGYDRTLEWIYRFQNATNTNGEPLSEVLKIPGENFWYSVSYDNISDFVMSMNCDKRLFVAKMQNEAIVDQRLIRFKVLNNNVEKTLIHALLNSIVSLFFIEANGFGRGLGVLDLSATRIRETLKILDPYLIDDHYRQEINTKFEILFNRDVKSLEDELNDLDRIDFDKTVLRAYGLEHLYSDIKESLLFLYNMRTKIF